MEKLNDDLFKNFEKSRIGNMDKILGGGHWEYYTTYSTTALFWTDEDSDSRYVEGGSFAIGRLGTV